MLVEERDWVGGYQMSDAIRERKNGLCPPFDSAPVHERSALYQGGILLGTVVSEGLRVLDFDRQDASVGSVNARHTFVGCVQTAHAVNPSVHVSPVEGWKLEDPIELVVERLPVRDSVCVDSCESNDHGGSV